MKGRKTPARLEQRDISAERPAVTDDGKIRGLAIPFNSPTTIGFGPMSFREKVAPGAVTKTLREADTVYLDNHDPAKPIARKSAGTLVMSVTERGVEYEASPADTSYARDLVANVRAGNIRGNSFGFEVVKDHWEIGADGVEERTLLEIKLPEISACTFPAYPDTEIGMRSAYEAAMEARDRFYQRDGKEPYGDVEYADPGYQKDGKKRYPIDTEKHVKAAWSYINQQDNADEYTSEQLAHIKAKIKAAAKKFGIEISDERNAAVTPEMRDDPDGKEYAAMREAIQHLQNGDTDAAREALENALPGDGDDDGDEEYGAEDSSGMVAHTDQKGASVPVRTAERIYELVREMPACATTNEALRLLEPFLQDTPAEERSENPKPGTSTSGIKLDSDEGIELQKRFRTLRDAYRP